MLFLDIRKDDEHARLLQLAEATRQHFSSFGTLSDSVPFSAHVTVAKLSQANNHGSWHRRNNKRRKTHALKPIEEVRFWVRFYVGFWVRFWVRFWVKACCIKMCLLGAVVGSENKIDKGNATVGRLRRKKCGVVSNLDCPI